MLTTKRYEYLAFDSIRLHPAITNHRPLNMAKVSHYRDDILKNGLLEPLIVWEKSSGEFYLAGGFHRMAAIRAIREIKPGYFDHVDVRVVGGDIDEIRALNLKLNADRADATIADYFDVVIYLHRVGWSIERIASFLDMAPELINDIITCVPAMPARLRTMLDNNTLSWKRACAICRTVATAPPERKDSVLTDCLQGRAPVPQRVKKPLTFKKAKSAITRHLEREPQARFQLSAHDLLALLVVLEGRQYTDEHIEQITSFFPELLQ